MTQSTSATNAYYDRLLRDQIAADIVARRATIATLPPGEARKAADASIRGLERLLKRADKKVAS